MTRDRIPPAVGICPHQTCAIWSIMQATALQSACSCSYLLQIHEIKSHADFEVYSDRLEAMYFAKKPLVSSMMLILPPQ